MNFVPLDGIRVLDLSRYLPGPYLTRILADLGAEVIKVEGPTGEGLRWSPPRHEGMGVAFASLNAGKRSIALDLKRPEGQALLHAMVPKVDILVESFRPGVLARFGLDAASLEARNPRLIRCSISGYGQTGTHRDVAGHDLNYVARSGLLSLVADGAVPPVQIGDVGSGSQPAAIGILAALIEREKTGRGRHLDVSLTRGCLSWGVIAYTSARHGYDQGGGAGMLTGGAANYRCYRTRDERYLSVAALEPRFFATFCTLIGLPGLSQTAMALGPAAEENAAQIAAVIAEKTLSEWMDCFAGHDVCVEPVLTPTEAMALPENADVVTEVDGYTVLRADVGAAASLPPVGPPRPLGADAQEICDDLSLDPALVSAARASGALVEPQ